MVALQMVIRLIVRIMSWTTVIAGCIIPVLLLTFPCNSLAGPILGARSAAMGCAFIAIDGDPSSLAHNPAGLINASGSRLYLGASAVMLSSRYENSEGLSERTRPQVFYPPHLFFSQEIGKKDMVIGLGLYSPFGIGGRSWRKGGLTRYISTENSIATYSLNPAIAWKISPWLAVGVSPCCMMVKSESEKMIDQSMFATSDARSSLKVDGGGYGYVVGILVHPVKNLSLGCSYRSKVRVDQQGSASLENIAPALQGAFGGSQFETRAKTRLDFPSIWGVGIAWRLSGKLLFTVDLEQYGWSSFDQQDLDFSTELQQAGFADITIPYAWKNSWVFDMGIELELNRKFAVRAGYSFIQDFIPDQTFSPANPSDDQHAFSIGIGYRAGRGVAIDIFYVVDFFQSREVRNEILSGTYDSICHFSGLSLDYRF